MVKDNPKRKQSFKLSHKKGLTEIPCEICGKNISPKGKNLHLLKAHKRKSINPDTSNNSIATTQNSIKEEQTINSNNILKNDKEEVKMSNMVSPEVPEITKDIPKEENRENQLNNNIQKIVNSLENLTETLSQKTLTPQPSVIPQKKSLDSGNNEIKGRIYRYNEDLINERKEFLKQQKNMCEQFPDLCQRVTSIESLLQKVTETPKAHSTIEDMKNCPSCSLKLQKYVDDVIKEKNNVQQTQQPNIEPNNIKEVSNGKEKRKGSLI